MCEACKNPIKFPPLPEMKIERLEEDNKKLRKELKDANICAESLAAIIVILCIAVWAPAGYETQVAYVCFGLLHLTVLISTIRYMRNKK